nr:hypothetical protein [Mycobacterium sp. E3298]
MDKEKELKIKREDKFETLMFAVDYIQKIISITGEFNNDDIFSCLKRIYDEGYSNGKRDALENIIYNAYHEIDSIEKDEA